MSNSTLKKSNLAAVQAPKALRSTQSPALNKKLRRSPLGSAIVDFAAEKNMSSWQLIDRAGINRSFFVDSAKRGFKSVQVNTLGDMIRKLKAIGFKVEPEILLDLIVPSAFE
jgi:hypothetical protein